MVKLQVSVTLSILDIWRDEFILMRFCVDAIPAGWGVLDIPGWPRGESTRLLIARRNPTLVRIQPPERCVVFHAGEADW
jgi:hypothetical protein